MEKDEWMQELESNSNNNNNNNVDCSTNLNETNIVKDAVSFLKK